MSDAPAADSFPNLLVVIGASAGGLQSIREIVRLLPNTFQGVVIVATHRDPNVSRNHLAEILSQDGRLTVREPVEGESLNCTTLYVGRPAESVVVDGRRAHIDEVSTHLERLHRIDELFLSAAKHAGRNTIGVILSGTLWDGIAGLEAINKAGGKCIVQHPHDASFDEMLRRAIEAVDIDYAGNTTEIAGILVEFAAGRSCE